MDAILANRQRHAWMDLIRKIERDEIVDEFTYRLYLRTPYYPTLIELGALRPFRFISPRCLINGQSRDGVRGYAGTGPWLLAEHKERQYALFTVNPLYRGEKPRIPAKLNILPLTNGTLRGISIAKQRLYKFHY